MTNSNLLLDDLPKKIKSLSLLRLSETSNSCAKKSELCTLTIRTVIGVSFCNLSSSETETDGARISNGDLKIVLSAVKSSSSVDAVKSKTVLTISLIVTSTPRAGLSPPSTDKDQLVISKTFEENPKRSIVMLMVSPTSYLNAVSFMRPDS